MRHGLAINATDRGHYEEARRELQLVLEGAERRYGTDHPRIAEILYSLGRSERYLGDYAAAEQILRRAHEIRVATLGEAHPQTAYALADWGVTLRAQGRSDEGCAAVREAFSVLETRVDPRHPNWRAARGIVTSCDIEAEDLEVAATRLESWADAGGAKTFDDPEGEGAVPASPFEAAAGARRARAGARLARREPRHARVDLRHCPSPPVGGPE